MSTGNVGVQDFHLRADNRADVKFRGIKVASVRSCDYTDRKDRWTELHLYQTTGKTYIICTIGMTTVAGEHVKSVIDLARSKSEVVSVLGHGWLAKYLYSAAGIDGVETID
jgi:hypothetical protein